jgi:hypothetical protein
MKKIILLLAVALSTLTTFAVPRIIYVTPNGSSSESVDGSSWANAVSLARGRNLANFYNGQTTENQIWMKAGTYDLTSSFQINIQITIYGGFAGDETTLSERNWVANQTILNQTGAAMVIWSSVEKDVLLDGLILQGGRPSTGSNGCGAITNGTTLRNCIVRNNKCPGGSGALGITNVSGATKNVIIENCLIINNESGTAPQALSIAVPNTEIRNTTIANNYNTTTATTAAITGSVAYKVYNSIIVNNYNGPNLARSFGTGTAKELANNAWDFAASDGTRTGNILLTSSPFVAATGFQGAANGTTQLLSTIESADFRLTSGSSCINAGNNTYATATSDLAGNNRIQNTTVDIGCYEVTPTAVSIVGGNLNNTGLTNIQLANTDITVSSGEFTIDASKIVKSITVAPGAKLTHSTGTMTATNGIILESDATGTATLMDSYTEPTITATVKQYLPQGRNWYMASPIETNIATATNLSAAGASSVSYYNETSGWVNNYAGTLVEGVGYIAVSSAGTSTNKINIAGKLNTGDVPVTLTNSPDAGKGFNLVGNPYPSYLSWSAVVTDNSAANMPTGTMWYRTTNYNGKSAWEPSKIYNQNDIVYNGTRFYKATSVTGTSAASGGPTGGLTGITDGGVTWNYEGSIYIFATVNASGVVAPETSPVSNLIPPMQAFWVKSTGGTLTFKNAMRSHNTGGTNALKAPKSSINNIKIIRLSVSNGASSDEAVIYASTDASNAFDTYDAPKYFNVAGSNQPEIYSQIGTEKLTINAMNEFSTATEITLGFATEKANNFSISATELKNVSPDMEVVLKDNHTNTEFELADGKAYTFSSPVVKDANRFSLLFKSKGSTTDIERTSKFNAQVFVNANNQISIITPEKATFSIYNAVGQLIENGIVNSKLETRNSKLNSGVYVVKVNNKSTRVIIK